MRVERRVRVGEDKSRRAHHELNAYRSHEIS